MFVKPSFRGKGIASRMVSELEKWGVEIGKTAAILETGNKQPEAIALYKKLGYQIIENYGQYISVAQSVCMKKSLHH